MAAQNMNIHPTAIVEQGAQVGQDVTIGPFTVIERDVVIGDGCLIGPHVFILRHTSLGEGCRVHAGAVLGGLPQDLNFSGEDSYVRIGKNCVIREHVTIHRGAKAGTVTEVGDGCFLMVNVHLAHNVRLGDRVIMANNTLLGGYVEVGERAFISGNVVVHQNCKIGRIAMVGGSGGFSKDIPPFCTTHPHALNELLGLNVIGMRRAGLKPEERLVVKRSFDLMFRSGLNFSQAIAKIRQEYPTGLGAEFADFVDKSGRGICRLSVNAEDESEV